jgi:hypothetical protein
MAACLQLRIYKTCVHLRCHVFILSCQDACRFGLAVSAFDGPEKVQTN